MGFKCVHIQSQTQMNNQYLKNTTVQFSFTTFQRKVRNRCIMHRYWQLNHSTDLGDLSKSIQPATITPHQNVPTTSVR